jgi:DNA-binding transcriptional regulator WhiA
VSFSSDIKSELMKVIPAKACCREALLSALCLGTSKTRSAPLKLQVESTAEARFILKLLHSCGFKKISWQISEEKRLHKRKIYWIEVPSSLDCDSAVRKTCCRRACARGSFIAAGYLTHPSKGYHLEWVYKDKSAAKKLRDVLKLLALEAGLSTRGKTYLVYVKKADDIAKLLNLMGAYGQLLKFEEVRALKETKNYVQRRVNSETANMAKIAAAAARQLHSIKILQQTQLLKKLSYIYRQIADLRLNHPEASLKELCSLTDPPLTKSTLAHRFKKLEQMAQQEKG